MRRASFLEIQGASISWSPKDLSRSVIRWLLKGCRASLSRVRIALVTVRVYLGSKMNFLTDLDEIWYRERSPCNPNVQVFSVVQVGKFQPIDLKDQKRLESFEMWCWRRMEKISWTDHVRNEEVLLRVNEQNILHEIRKRKANWIGHILRRNCLLQQVIEGKIKGQIEVARRRGRRRKKLLDDLKDRRGYCQLKEEALYRTMWRNRFGRGLDLSFDRLLMMMRP